MRDREVEIDNFKDADWALASFEHKWSSLVPRVSLITELDVPQPEIDGLFAAVRWLNRNRHDDLLRSLRRIPSSVAVLMIESAIRNYEGGAFWPNYFSSVNGYGTNLEREAWGEAFLSALRKFDLPRFDSEGSKKYLSPVLAHAGVPNYCLGDYFAALDRAIRQVGVDADAVTSWAASRADTSLVNIDVPVRRFLGRGDEFTMDFIDRTIDVLGRLSRDEDPARAMLPDRVVDAARLHLEGSRRSGRRLGIAKSGTVEQLARVTLDPFEGELILTLPPIDAVDDDVTWLVMIEGQADTVHTVKQMGGWSIGIREATYPVRRAAKAISISAHGVERSQDIDLVDPEEPLLVFSQAGELIPSHVPLPSGQVWALYALPLGQSPSFSGRIVHDAVAPLGWTGWSLSALDLNGAHELRLTEGHRPRSVRNDARVTLETLHQVPYVRSAGMAVHGARPVLHIPDGITAAWRLSVTDLDTGNALVDREVASSSDVHDTTDPFEGLAVPVVGRYSVVMRGPLGKGLSATVAIAEGLKVDSSVPVRTFVPGGLTACVMNLTGVDMEVAHPELRFAPGQIEKSTEVESHEGRLEILVTPPAMAVALEVDGVPDRWRYSALTAATEDVGRTRLHLRLPHEGEPVLRVVADSGSELQSISPVVKVAGAGRGHQAAFDLREASDVIARAGSCTLVIGTSPSIRLARVSARTLAHGALSADGGIQLVDFAGGSVAGRMWSLWEPWIPPADFGIDAGGFVPLPESLAGRGPVALHLQIVDPWVPEELPSLPVRHQSLFVEQSPSAESQDSTLALAGRVEQHEPLALAQAWSLLEMRMHAPRQFYPLGAVESLTACLRERPTDALAVLADRRGAAEEQVQLLVSSGLLWSAVESGDSLERATDEHMADLLSAAPFVGALVSARHLAKRDSMQTMPTAWQVARKVLGMPFATIIEGAGDPVANQGRLDQTRWLDAKSPDEFRELVSALGILPQGLLHGDARVEAALAVFAERKRSAVRDLGGVAWALTRRCREELAGLGAEALVRAVDARTADVRRELPIAHVSSASLALALMARLASRGLPGAHTLVADVRRYIDDLARYAPALLAMDVVLAEAHVCALLAEEHPRATNVENEDE